MTLTTKLKDMRRREQGFTIVELLIVIVVIAILAALVITSYLGIQARARDSERQSDVRALATAVQAYVTLKDGTYPTCAQILDGTVENVEADAKTGPGFTGTAAFNTTAAPASGTASQYYCSANSTGVRIGYYSESKNPAGAVYRTIGTPPAAP